MGVSPELPIHILAQCSAQPPGRGGIFYRSEGTKDAFTKWRLGLLCWGLVFNHYRLMWSNCTTEPPADKCHLKLVLVCEPLMLLFNVVFYLFILFPLVFFEDAVRTLENAFLLWNMGICRTWNLFLIGLLLVLTESNMWPWNTKACKCHSNVVQFISAWAG